MSTQSANSGVGAPEQANPAQNQLTGKWDWLGYRVCIFLVVLLLYVFWGNPIPWGGYENRDRAISFVKELFPHRPVLPADTSTASVAVLFSVIRSGDNVSARRAIDFAADQEFGNASPYVIERLESTDGQLRHSARAFLIRIAGEDHGPSADAWRAWWRNPTRRLLGIVPVGQRTLEWAMPVLVFLSAFFFWALRRRRTGGPPLSWVVFYLGLLCAWFMTFVVLAHRLVGGSESCTFGAETIRYYSSHGSVLGLEDARLGGGALFMLLSAGYIGVPAAIAGLWMLFISWRRS
jgi:hypothetical protein